VLSHQRPLGRLGGVLLGLALVAMTAAVLVPFRARTTTATDALALVVPVVAAGWAGGRVPSLVTAGLATATLNVAFLEPYGTARIHFLDDVVALVVFSAVALAVGTVVAVESDRRLLAEQRTLELERLHEERRSMEEDQQRLAAEKRALEMVGDYRGALLRSVSHDLRTPLATIRAVASDLRDGTDYDEPTRAELLDLVGDEAERLDRLVANLLSLSRIEAGSLAPDRQAVPLDELLTDRVRKLRRVLRDVRVQLDVPFTLPLADADYTLLDQVVTNLLENAARHSPEGGTVRVRARARDQWLEVAVSDQGPGIDPADADRIFEPFTRGTGSSSSGVGLAICRAIVEAHGGAIAARGANGGGAEMVFTIPVRS
jgi:two-component system, OmpR family, sensor histidine kinase KdpD